MESFVNRETFTRRGCRLPRPPVGAAEPEAGFLARESQEDLRLGRSWRSSIVKRALALLADGGIWSPPLLMERLELDRRQAQSALRLLYRTGRILRVEEGRYRLLTDAERETEAPRLAVLEAKRAAERAQARARYQAQRNRERVEMARRREEGQRQGGGG